MLKIGVFLLVAVEFATALHCNSCDNYVNCSNPASVPCPPHSKCYTLTRNGEITAKGCAHSCQAISYLDGHYCQACSDKDYCNDLQPAHSTIRFRCYTCNSTKTCEEPFIEDCVTDEGCYTIKNMDTHKVISKGCLENAANLMENEYRNDCNNKDHCNTDKEQGIGMNVELKHIFQDRKDGTSRISKEDVGGRLEMAQGIVTTTSFTTSIVSPIFAVLLISYLAL
ncbi:hypothetical protein B9Z55_012478 [Caenorhabditis nigoni]|uniref:UPAR/Ly6 domain-containing protein n=1 Tax=Caenorhabditis nigoni TaxID=1611254 RepID=A0A2G5TXC0_9PELO|nr:hypothetical protein B9Z55_012478 [Caenorhabditis nigoni]